MPSPESPAKRITARSITSRLVLVDGGTSASVDISWPKPPLFSNSPPGSVARIRDEAVRIGWLRRLTAESRPLKDTTLGPRRRKSVRLGFAHVSGRQGLLRIASAAGCRHPTLTASSRYGTAARSGYFPRSGGFGFFEGALQVRGGLDPAEPGADTHKGFGDDGRNPGEDELRAARKQRTAAASAARLLLALRPEGRQCPTD